MLTEITGSCSLAEHTYKFVCSQLVKIPSYVKWQYYVKELLQQKKVYTYTSWNYMRLNKSGVFPPRILDDKKNKQ